MNSHDGMQRRTHMRNGFSESALPTAIGLSKDRFPIVTKREWMQRFSTRENPMQFALLLLSLLAIGPFAYGQDRTGKLESKGVVPINMDELPEPPEEIAALIKAAKVTMEVGKRENDANLSPSIQPGRLGPRKLLGETRYRISFNYRSHTRWRTTGNNVRITLRVSQIRWEPKHVIWLRRMPSKDDFWTDSLVQHEFDHVRISNDPRFNKEFEKRVRASLVLNRTNKSGQRVNQAWVDREVDEHMTGIFDDVSELVSIRYKELDRVTDHGLQTIPPDSPLARFLEAKDEDLPKDRESALQSEDRR